MTLEATSRANMQSWYLIRYGLSQQLGRFQYDSPDLLRGQTVVIRSHRGTELGGVLIKIEPNAEEGPPSLPSAPESARILRVAGRDDLERARQLERERPHRFDLCRRVIEENGAPLELIDVEPLLEDRRTVLHYFGPHRLDIADLVATLRSTYDVEVVFEPAGRDLSEAEEPEDHGCGRCGSSGGGCGSGSGCSTGSPSSSQEGCSDCGIKGLLASKRRRLAAH